MGEGDFPVRCNLCGNVRHYLVYQKPRGEERDATSSYRISDADFEKPDKIVRCTACALVYVYPTENADELLRAYRTMDDEDYLREEAGRLAQAREVLDAIGKYKGGGQILDIGCGPGFLLNEARRRGFQPHGVELSAWAKEYCEEHFRIPIFQGTLQEGFFKNQSFDVIVLTDVIEHVTDPMATFIEIRRILKDDGVVYLSTPDIGSFWSRILRVHWWGINKFHLFYFTRKTLERYFKAAGLNPIRYFTFPRIFSIRYWAKRLRPYLAFVQTPIEFLVGVGSVKGRLLSITLFDQIGVVAEKIQRLDSLDTRLGIQPQPPKMQRQKVVAVLPAYNAAKTLELTVKDIPRNAVDEIILVDDASWDDTVRIAKKLGLTVYSHKENKGYGANQKTCYGKALERGADIAVMVHPDYQYDPRIIPQLIEPILKGEADAVFGSRMMKDGALEGGMPLWKYSGNILLTAFENIVLGAHLTEYHSGFRAYSAHVLRRIDFRANSDNFVFDTEIVVQLVANRFRIHEVPIRTRYFEEASCIRFIPSVIYGFSILGVMFRYMLHRTGILKWHRLEFLP